MPNNINVSIKGSNLDVTDNGGQNQVGKNQNGPTKITWNLTGLAAQGSFLPITDDPATSGFSWVAPAPPTGYFGKPSLGANNNSLSIDDNHFDSSTDGTWIYQLQASYQGKTYATTHSLHSGGTVDNPVIINH